MFITTQDVLIQIREDTGNTEAIYYINNIIPVVEETVFNYINRFASGFTSGGTTGTTGTTGIIIIPYPIKQAMKSYAGTLYNNRESLSPNQMYEVPQAYEYLLLSYINYGNTF